MGLPRALDELAMAVGDTCRVEKSVNLLSMLADQACVSPHWMSDQCKRDNRDQTRMTRT
jgi:hypothetical protein